MDYDELLAKINYVVKNSGTSYSAWTIGVTDRPEERRSEQGNPSTWENWRTDSEQTGRNVERYFKSQGMNGDLGGPGDAKYVYIF